MNNILIKPYLCKHMSVTDGGIYTEATPNRFGLEVFGSPYPTPQRSATKTGIDVRGVIADVKGHWFESVMSNGASSHLGDALLCVAGFAEVTQSHKGIFVLDYCNLDMREIYEEDLGLFIKNIGMICKQNCNDILGKDISCVVLLLDDTSLKVIDRYRDKLASFEKETRTHIHVVETVGLNCLMCEFGGVEV